MSSNRYIGAIEMGTSKVNVLIGQFELSKSLHIVGFGECQSHGIMKGSVVDAKRAGEAVHAAIAAAEKVAGDIRMEAVYLAQTGAHLDGFYNAGVSSISATDGRVRSGDIERVWALAKAKNLPEDRSVVHQLRRPFRVDGQIVRDPEGIVGEKLEVGCWTVHGQTARLRDNINIIQDFQISVRNLVVSSLASARVVTSPLDRQQGVLVLDIGAGTTDFVLYRDGAVLVTGVLPVGGVHLTNDLSLGLSLGEGEAELMKIRHGRATFAARDRGEKVWVDGSLSLGDRQVSRMAIEQIITARVREIFEVVLKKLGNAFSPETTGAGVVLTGGTAKLDGIADVATAVFGVPARVGEAPAWVEKQELRDPRHSTGLGLLEYILMHERELAGARRSRSGLGGILGTLFGGKK